MLLNDEEILEALSDIGVFIRNYVTGNSSSSDKWTNLPKSFSTEGEKDFLKHIHEDDRKAVETSLLEVYEGKKKYLNEIYRLVKSDGSFRWIKSYGKIVKQTEDGKPLLFIGSDSDITELKNSQEKEKKRAKDLEILEQILKVISSSLDLNTTVHKVLLEMAKIIPYETCSIQVLKGDKLIILDAEGFSDNEEVCNLEFNYPENGSLSTYALGQNKAYLTNNVEKDFPSFTHPDDYIPVLSWIGVPLIAQSGIVGLLAFDGYRTNHFDEHHLELCSIIGDHIAIAMENAMLHENAFKLAMEDSLTGVGSRHRIAIEGRLLCEAANRNKKPLSLVIIDLDEFKLINDQFGHDIGDIVLKDFTKLCLNEIRDFDLLARYGGDEFIIMMPETNSEQAVIVLERIRLKVSKYINENIGSTISISGGIATGIPNQIENLAYYITMADKELYKSKTLGRNRVSHITIN